MSPSNNETTFAEKILYVLRRLREDRRAQDAEQQLVTAVCEVVADGYKKEVMQMVKEVDHKVHVPTMVMISWVHVLSRDGVMQHEVITEPLGSDKGNCILCVVHTYVGNIHGIVCLQ